MRTNFGGIGKDAIKATNMFAILSIIYKNGSVSRRDIAKLARLTPSTITLLVAEMISYGLLCEDGEVHEAGRAGRRIVRIRINNNFGCLLGVCVEPSRLSLALSYLDGEVIDKMVVANTFCADELIDRLLQLSGELLARQKGGITRFCAIGISISGRVDPAGGISVDSYGILPPGVPVIEAFTQRFKVPAFLDNNVRSLAAAELGFHRSGEEINGLFIKHDPGFGCAVLVQGEVFKGKFNSSGEIGHARVMDNGSVCICGKTGCLSTVVSTTALIKSASGAFSPSATPVLWKMCGGLPEQISVSMLVRSAASGDAPIARLLGEAAEMMARAIETSLLAMDGNTVITFGAIFEEDWFFSQLQTALEKSFASFREIHVTRSCLPDNDRWKGAVFIALEKYLEYVSHEIGETDSQ